MTAYSFTSIDTKSPWTSGDQYTVRAYFDVSTTSGGTGLANTDTITATGLIPANGVKIYDVMVVHPELDTNATPTGTFNVGDAGSATRFISGAPLGVTGVTTTGFQLRTGINIITTTTSGVVASGAGYIYTGTSTSSIIVTVSAAVATAATSGILHLLVTYRCVGNS
jgi:hypothetical protein